MMSLVMIQLKKPGAPVFFAANFGVFDMHHGLCAMAAPENSLLLNSLAQIARDFKLPSWGCAGTTDSKCLDFQAGMESSFSILSQGLGGINLIHDVGYMDMGMICSAEMLVLGNEAAGMAKRFMQSFQITPETMAIDVIDKVGPGGNYLQEAHTMAHFKKCWYPELSSRSSFATWQDKGEKTMVDQCHSKVKKILEIHNPAELKDTIKEAIIKIRKAGEQEILGGIDGSLSE